jgi:glycosyltransferase involved in cell wall biosynthesis
MTRVALFLPHLDVSGGLGVHCRMLVAALAATPSSLRFTVYSPARPQELFPNTAAETFDAKGMELSRFEFRTLDVPRGFNLANELDPILAGPLSAIKPDRLYCSYYTGMRQPPCRQIVAFHDAGFLENPAGFGETAAIRKRTIDAIRPAISLIQCISKDARDRICRCLPWEVEKTAVVWHALPDSPEEIAAALATTPDRVPFEKPYFFCPVGAATGFNRIRKNVPTVVTAFRMLPHGTARLVIAGTAPLSEKVLAELLPPGERGQVTGGAWHAVDGAVTILPSLSRDEFLASMRHAVAVVYPSRYEGFGLPTIEALALGVPLIASRATSIPEVVGNAGILVEPDDVEGFRAAMESAMTDPARMAKLIQSGRERVGLFSLERMGQEMASLFGAESINDG